MLQQFINSSFCSKSLWFSSTQEVASFSSPGFLQILKTIPRSGLSKPRFQFSVHSSQEARQWPAHQRIPEGQWQTP